MGANTIPSQRDDEAQRAVKTIAQILLDYVYQTRVKPCLDGLLAGNYWYGSRRKEPGQPPKWVEKILSDGVEDPEGAEPEDEEPKDQEPVTSVASFSAAEITKEPPRSEPTRSEVPVNKQANHRYLLRRNPKPREHLHYYMYRSLEASSPKVRSDGILLLFDLDLIVLFCIVNM